MLYGSKGHRPDSGFLTAVLVAASAFSYVAHAGAQTVPVAAPAVTRSLAAQTPVPGLSLRITTAQAHFAQGEPIPITMRYTYTGTRKLRVEAMTYDRSGRIPEFQFRGVDALGHPVPDPAPMTISMGGIRTIPDLTPDHPHQQTVYVNEWLRFDHPGRYTVTLRSTAVQVAANDPSVPIQGIPLESNALQIEITPPDNRHRLERIERARRDIEGGEEAQERAMRDLRFMVDPRAIPLLMQGLKSPYGNVQSQAQFGLRSFADMSPVRAALLAALHNPASNLDVSQEDHYATLLAEAQLRAEGGRLDKDLQASQPFNALFNQWKVAFDRAITARNRHDSALFVSSYQGNNVRRISSTAQNLGDVGTQIGKPTGIATDHEGYLYVIDTEAHAIRRFSPTGADLGVFVEIDSGTATKLAFDAQGNLYVAEFDRVLRYTSRGQLIGSFADQRIDNAYGLAFDRAGNLYVSCFNTGLVRCFARDGSDLGDFVHQGLRTPMGLTFDRQGNLYVADYNRHVVRRYAPDGKDMGDFATEHLGFPNGLAFDAQGNLYVADGDGVKRFSAQGRYLGVWGVGGMLTGDVAFGPLPAH
jgi:sugar lactone lactonase YvrE